MREELFNYFVKVGNDLQYYKLYSISTRRFRNVYTGITLLFSSAGFVALSIWDTFPILWALIMLFAQGIQALSPLFQASKQRDALKFILQDTSKIFNEIARYWDTIQLQISVPNLKQDSDQDIHSHICEWRERQESIEERFTGDVDFPVKKRLVKKAQIENEHYFWYHYKVKTQEEYTNE